MLDFFPELARKLAERWVALLVVPGAQFAATAMAGWRLGWRDTWDLPGLVRDITRVGRELARWPTATQVLLVLAVGLGISAIGLAVQGLAGLTRAVWLGDWPAWPRRAVVSWRQRRWDTRVEQRQRLQEQWPAAGRSPAHQDAVDQAAARITRLSATRPGRPTWIGDRGHAVERIAMDRYGLDLTYGWPRLWLVLPEPVRVEITAAHAAFVSSVAVASWAWPHLALAVVWWPAAVIAVIIGGVGWIRGRCAAHDLATLSEAAVDLHGRDLAVALGVVAPGTTGPLTPPDGAAITAIVRKGR